jgi:hypothetical protein
MDDEPPPPFKDPTANENEGLHGDFGSPAVPNIESPDYNLAEITFPNGVPPLFSSDISRDDYDIQEMIEQFISMVPGDLRSDVLEFVKSLRHDVEHPKALPAALIDAGRTCWTPTSRPSGTPASQSSNTKRLNYKISVDEPQPGPPASLFATKKWDQYGDEIDSLWRQFVKEEVELSGQPEKLLVRPFGSLQGPIVHALHYPPSVVIQPNYSNILDCTNHSIQLILRMFSVDIINGPWDMLFLDVFTRRTATKQFKGKTMAALDRFPYIANYGSKAADLHNRFAADIWDLSTPRIGVLWGHIPLTKYIEEHPESQFVPLIPRIDPIYSKLDCSSTNQSMGPDKTPNSMGFFIESSGCARHIQRLVFFMSQPRYIQPQLYPESNSTFAVYFARRLVEFACFIGTGRRPASWSTLPKQWRFAGTHSVMDDPWMGYSDAKSKNSQDG